MNDRSDEFDPRLEELFRREHTHLPPEPFSTAALHAIAADRQRVARGRRLTQAAAVIALILAAPRLVEASVWISFWLDELFASVSAWLASPLGLGAGIGLGALAALVAKRRRTW